MARYALGKELARQGRWDEAAHHLKQSLRFKPAVAEAWMELARVEERRRRWEDAIACYRQAIQRSPDTPLAHYLLSLLLLRLGRFAEGWSEYEWRWQTPGFSTPRRVTGKEWDGTAAQNQTVLLHAEQGFGDTIQFCRFAPLVRERSGRVLLIVPPELRALLGTAPGIDEVLTNGCPWPEFDCHLPLMSLPRVLGTTIETIPTRVPYLAADMGKAATWELLLPPRHGLRVGLAWQGRPEHENDSNRSMPLSHYAPLSSGPGIELISLQVGAPDTGAAAAGLALVDRTAHIRDFSDTAALIACLDLVISVDTSVAHLAGALGKPIWLLLPHHAEWRWLPDEDRSPWYPTMRLFRQTQPGDWNGVIVRVSEELHALTAQTNAPLPGERTFTTTEPSP